MTATVQAAPIAIIGVAVRTAGSGDTTELWRMLENGTRAIAPVPDNRLPGLDTGPITLDRPRAALLDGIDQFDAAFFGISRRMAAWTDPHHRLLLELSWHALEDAGLDVDRLRGERVAVVAATAMPDYQLRMCQSRVTDTAAFSGTLQTFLPNRISYQFDWTGPSFAVDSACSSGLTALCTAVNGLHRGEYPMALVAAANLVFHSFLPSNAYRAGALSPTGMSVPFGAGRDGYIRGEGGACLLLKPLADAEREGDRIHAVIRAIGLAHDGRAGGLTGTDPRTQTELIKRTFSETDLVPADLGCLEAHGTGTKADFVEITALARALAESSVGQRRPAGPDGRLWVGSIKSNIGHLEGAAGLLGVVKAVLILRHHVIPEIAGLTSGGSTDTEHAGVALADRSVIWPPSVSPRRISVNSFGIGGSLGHAILEDPPAPVPVGHARTRLWPVPISAATGSALAAVASQLREALSEGQHAFDSVVFTLQTGRTSLAHRRIILAADSPQLCTGLAAVVIGASHELVVDRACLDALTRLDTPLADVARAWLHGESPAWIARWPRPWPRRTGLPGYPFERRSHWFESTIPTTSTPVV